MQMLHSDRFVSDGSITDIVVTPEYILIKMLICLLRYLTCLWN
jgi:hypothetical protein